MTRRDAYAEIHQIENGEWRLFAACKGYPTSWWYPADGMNGPDQRQARIICSNCDVREDCLMSALVRNEKGIWGQTNIRERRKIRRDLNIQKILICQYCRNPFEKPATRKVVSMYCSDLCRKSQHSGRIASRKSFGQAS